jgi:hypothetical protein
LLLRQELFLDPIMLSKIIALTTVVIAAAHKGPDENIVAHVAVSDHDRICLASPRFANFLAALNASQII